ncbi:MAG: hypothetical protein IJ754_05100 [Bacteroidaceae bacterium]|nr:hypothetical protein [Bacteroidaceae bacterium]
MKRLLLFALSLLTMASATWAQPEPDPLPTEPVLIPENHWTYTEGQFQNETFIYADFVVTTPDGVMTYTSQSDLNNYQFAAFITNEAGEEELRAVGEVVRNTYIQTYEAYLLRFRVEGSISPSGDLNKPITFKAYEKSTGREYDLEMRETPLPTFTGETLDPGVPSNPRHLYLTPVSSITLSDITMNVGEEVDLMDYLNLDPENATLPNNISWVISSEGEGLSIDGSTLTAIAPYPNGVSISAMVGNQSAAANVYVFQPATSISQLTEAITVNLYDDDRLNAQLAAGAAYNLVPADATDYLRWTSQDENIIVFADASGQFMTRNSGEVTMIGRLYSHDGTIREDIAPIQLTVTVVQPVTGITTRFDFSPNEATHSYNAIDCLPGDDLTPYFVDGMAFNIQPANATNKAVTIEYETPNLNEHAVSIGADGKITVLNNNAVSEGIKVTSQEDPTKSTTVYIIVHHETQEISAPSPSVNVSATEFPKDITEQLNEAIVMTPSDGYPYDLYFDVQSSDPTVVEYVAPDLSAAQPTDPAFIAKKAGTTTITATIKVKDWLAATFDATGDDHVTLKSASFDLTVTEGLSGLDLDFSESEFMAPGGSQFTIKPIPSTASLGEDLDKFTITATYADNEAWTPLEVVDFGFDEEGNVVAYTDCRIPGNAIITVHFDDGSANGLSVTSDPVQIGYAYNFGSGWQWQSIPFGDPAGEKLDLSTIYGDDLIEIRTQSEQLYNDPQYGYFGDNHLISQNTCFKLKMNENPETNEYIFTSGQLGQVPDITLRAGWNWIPNPFFFDRWLNLAFTEMAFENGDRIVSFADGFVEFEDGDWIGTLEEFKCGQGYMFYNAGSEGRTLPFVNELTLPDDHDRYTYTAPARRLPDYALFTYDPSRFRDNMTIVAQLENVPFVDNCRVFAFVGDECRGQGAAVQGKLFITVHGQAGETITFKLYDDDTRDLCEINESVPFQSMLGTVRQPLKMQKGKTIVTGVQGLGTGAAATESFDLSGRRISGSQRGISIQRLSDGSVRKVVRK